MKFEKSDVSAGCLAAVSIVIQWALMYASQVFEVSLPFACGLSAAAESRDAVSQLLFFIIPVPFLLWVFSGRTERMISVIHIIRNDSRKKIMLKEIIRTGAAVMLLELFTCLVFSLGKAPQWECFGVKNEMKVMAVWTAVMMAVVLLQMLLELMLHVPIAQIAVLLYYMISIFAGSLLPAGTMIFLGWMFFPSMGFSCCNQVTDGGEYAFGTAFAGALLLCAGLSAVAVQIVKKKDIL